MPITAEQLCKVPLQHTTLFAAFLSSKDVIDMSHVCRSAEALTSNYLHKSHLC